MEKEEIHNLRPSGNVRSMNKRTINLLRRILKRKTDSNELVTSDIDVDTGERLLEDSCGLPLLSNKHYHIREQSIKRLDPKSKYLKSKYEQKRKKLRRLMKKTNKAVSVGNKLSTIPESTSSIATSNCGSDTRCDNIDIEDQSSHASSHERVNDQMETSQILVDKNEKLITKTNSLDEKLKAELKLENGRILENFKINSYSDPPAQIYSCPVDIFNVKSKVSATSESSTIVSQKPFSRSEYSAFESLSKDKKHITQISRPFQTKSQHLENSPPVEENTKSQNSNTTKGNISHVSLMSDNLNPPRLLRIVNPSFVFGEEGSNEVSYVPSQETSIPTISSINDGLKSDTSSCLRAIKKEYEIMQNQLWTKNDLQQNVNEIPAILGYKQNLMKEVVVLNRPSVDNTSVSTISADTQASDTRNDKRTLDEKEKKCSEKEQITSPLSDNVTLSFDVASKNKRIDESQDTATCSQSSSSQSSSIEGGWIDETNIHSITINGSNPPHLIFTDEISK